LGEAAVEFIAPGARQAGDFTVTSHGFGVGLMVWERKSITGRAAGAFWRQLHSFIVDSIHCIGHNDKK